MDLYQKVEKVIQEHILEHQEEVFNAKTLLRKLDVARCNQPKDGKSSYWYDYDRNDPNRPNPFGQTPDYTELPE